MYYEKVSSFVSSFSLILSCEHTIDNTVEQPSEDCYITLNMDIVNIDPNGGSVDIRVYSNYTWVLTSNNDWFDTSITSGYASDDGVVVTISADRTYEDREGTITFNCGNAKKLLVVKQSLKEVIIADENNTLYIPAEGGIAEIKYQTNIDCEIVIPETAKEWITIDTTRALISESVMLNIAENTTYNERTAIVKIIKAGSDELYVEYTISQEQNEAILADDSKIIVGGWSDTVTIDYLANIECKVVIPGDAQEWISLMPDSRTLTQRSATLNIAANDSSAERSTTVKVVAVDNENLSVKYIITQNPRYTLKYTSTDGAIVTPNNADAFNAKIISNTYVDNIGIIEFESCITTIGSKAFYNCSSLLNVTIPDSVTTIEWSAFSECVGLENVTIPNSVTEIGGDTFRDCSSLKSVTIPDSVKSIREWAFQGCSSLTSLIIPNSVTDIRREAFAFCSNLRSVTMSNNIETFEGNVFRNCDSLTEFNGKYASADGRCLIIEGVLKSFAPAGITEYTIPDNVITIGVYAFYNCNSLTSVTIPNSVTTIEASAFDFCRNLTNVTIGDNVKEIGNYAFLDCTSLTNVYCKASIPPLGGHHMFHKHYGGNYETPIGCVIYVPTESLETYQAAANWSDYVYYIVGSNFDSTTTITYTTTDGKIANFNPPIVSNTYSNGIGEVTFYGRNIIPDYAFRDCSNLNSITLPDGLTSIGDSAFYGCNNLTSITIPNSVTTIGDHSFFGCSSLTDIVVGKGIISIGEWAFYDCTGELTINCNIPNVSYPDNRVFYGAKFTSITIGDSVITIGDYAFSSCNNLTNVTISDSVTTIGDDAFYNCSNLNSVYCKAITPPNIGKRAFAKYDYEYYYDVNIGCSIYVPTESVEAYKAAEYWGNYADYIVGYDFSE